MNLSSLIDAFASWLTRNNLRAVFETVRTVFIIADIGLVTLLVFTLGKALEFRPNFRRNPREARTVSRKDPGLGRRWQELLAKADANPPHSYALAIIEADKLVDEALKRLGFQGEHMADRLEHLNTGDLKTLEPLWRAHRLRNELVHAPEFELSETDARSALETYGKFLKELGIL